MKFQASDGGYLASSHPDCHLPDVVGDGRRYVARVVTEVHRGSPGMVGLAGDSQFGPGDSLDAGDGSDSGACGLQYWTLLDVQFEIGSHRPPERQVACPTQSVQLGTHGDTVDIRQAPHFAEIDGSGPNGRTHHRPGKAGPLLVGPYSHLERRHRVDTCVGQRGQHFEAAEPPVHAVEPATRGLSVEVAPQHHWQCVLIGALPAGKQVADGIGGQGAAHPGRPLREQGPTCCVIVRERLAVGTSRRRGAHLGHGHEARPQAAAVDMKVGLVHRPSLPPRVGGRQRLRSFGSRASRRPSPMKLMLSTVNEIKAPGPTTRIGVMLMKSLPS